MKNIISAFIGLGFFWAMPLIDLAVPKYRIYADLVWLGCGFFCLIFYFVMGVVDENKTDRQTSEQRVGSEG
jgi:hypothetical protein